MATPSKGQQKQAAALLARVAVIPGMGTGRVLFKNGDLTRLEWFNVGAST